MSDPPSGRRVEAEWTIPSERYSLRLTLIWTGDRYGHLLQALSPAGEAPASLQSLEGACPVGQAPPDVSPGTTDLTAGSSSAMAPSDDWPASPAFQQFHQQEIDGRRTWFLVGMAGKSHFSACVTALADGDGWEFDMACRYVRPPEFLGACYSVARTEATWHRPPIGRLVPLDDATRIVLRTAPVVSVVPALLSPPPASARWRYAWRV